MIYDDDAIRASFSWTSIDPRAQALKICPICSTEYPPEEEFCSKDGQKLFHRHAVATDPLVGKVLEGRYRVNRLLGEGGMGRVYLATNINAEMEVALKILNRAATQDRDVVKRFETERRIISRLRHPNILKLLDSFHVETGELVIVVEYVAGMTLEEEIAKGRLSELRTLYILKEVFDALTEAHKAGIIHRDLKPSNIMLEEIGDRTLVKILDFGIAKHLGSTGLTAGGTLGTPAYMSPEQVEGLALDGRSDIYSMGIVAYECLSGRPPFEGENAFSIIRKHIMEKPKALGQAVPPIPVSRRVEAFIFHLLEKAPQDRPIDARAARELVEALYRFTLEQKGNTTRPLPFDMELPDDDDTIEAVKAETLLPQAALLLANALVNQANNADQPAHGKDGAEETLEGVAASTLLPNAPALFDESIVSSAPNPVEPGRSTLDGQGHVDPSSIGQAPRQTGASASKYPDQDGSAGLSEADLANSLSQSQSLIEPVSQALSDPETAPFSIVDMVEQQSRSESTTDSLGVLSTDGITRMPDDSSASLSTGDLNWHEDTTALQDSVIITASQADTDAVDSQFGGASKTRMLPMILGACLIIGVVIWFMVKPSDADLDGVNHTVTAEKRGLGAATGSGPMAAPSDASGAPKIPAEPPTQAARSGADGKSAEQPTKMNVPTLPKPTFARDSKDMKAVIETAQPNVTSKRPSREKNSAAPPLSVKANGPPKSTARRVVKKHKKRSSSRSVTKKKATTRRTIKTRANKKLKKTVEPAPVEASPNPASKPKKVQAKYDDDLFD
ncbi:MAG: protein kinase [Myxococcota bacterium]|nr:protein kinase [Myxococcota bacterium]